MLGRLPTLFALALALGLRASIAIADDGTELAAVRFSWVRAQGAQSCPTVTEIEHDVIQRLGRDPFGPSPARTIESVVTRDGGQWRARIYLYDSGTALSGVREMTSDAPTCEPIRSAVSLAVALAIDPDAALRAPSSASPSPSPAPASSSPPSPSPSPSASPTPLASSPMPAPVRRHHRSPAIIQDVDLEAAMGLGLQPQFSPGARLAVNGFVIAPLRWTVGALWLSESRTLDGRFGFGLVALFTGLCGDLVPVPRITLAVCATVMTGAMNAVVYQPIPRAPGEYPWIGISAGADISVRLIGPLFVRVGASFVVPLIRWKFAVEGEGTPAFQQDFVAGTIQSGLGVQFR